MRNAMTAVGEPNERILIAGRTGAGKSALIWTLPGKKFAYLFDPNAMRTLQGLDVDVQEYYPDFGEIDHTLKGFNKGSKSDKPKDGVVKEPKAYETWVDDINEKVDSKFFEPYKWLVIDSATFLVKAVMDRQLYINQRYGDLQDLGDYRVVGNKLTDVFRSISGLPINVYVTGHISTFQDDKTKKIETQLQLPGSARTALPLMFTNIWQAFVKEDSHGKLRHMIRTQPDPKGLQDLRSSLQLAAEEDVTIEDFSKAEQYGIGKLLNRGAKVGVHQRKAG